MPTDANGKRFAEGNYVRVHPAHDLFMRGVKYATVTSIGRKWLHMFHMGSNTKHKMSFRRAAVYLEIKSR